MEISNISQKIPVRGKTKKGLWLVSMKKNFWGHFSHFIGGLWEKVKEFFASHVLAITLILGVVVVLLIYNATYGIKIYVKYPPTVEKEAKIHVKICNYFPQDMENVKIDMSDPSDAFWVIEKGYLISKLEWGAAVSLISTFIIVPHILENIDWI